MIRQPAVGGEHAAQLAERGSARVGVVLGVEPVAGVVGADVLERRDAEDEVERAVAERQVADVGLDARQTGNVGGGEVDADELVEAGPEQGSEVRRLRERVPDLEPRRPRRAREHPRELDHALVRAGGPWSQRGRSPRSRAPRAKAIPSSSSRIRSNSGAAASSCTSVARERSLAELGERPLARPRVGVAAQDEREDGVDEVLVRAVARVQPGPQLAAHE